MLPWLISFSAYNKNRSICSEFLIWFSFHNHRNGPRSFKPDQFGPDSNRKQLRNHGIHRKQFIKTMYKCFPCHSMWLINLLPVEWQKIRFIVSAFRVCIVTSLCFLLSSYHKNSFRIRVLWQKIWALLSSESLIQFMFHFGGAQNCTGSWNGSCFDSIQALNIIPKRFMIA